MDEQRTQAGASHDVSIVRPQMRNEMTHYQADEDGHITRWRKLLEAKAS